MFIELKNQQVLLELKVGCGKKSKTRSSAVKYFGSYLTTISVGPFKITATTLK